MIAVVGARKEDDMKYLTGALIGIAASVVLLFGYNEYRRQQMINAIRAMQEPAPANSVTSDKGLSATDFEIISFTPRWEGGRLRAIGEIRNRGSIPGGPEVEVIARDASGTLIASKTFWPNSINNIPPGGTCGVAFTITQDKRAKTAHIKVVGVRTWQ